MLTNGTKLSFKKKGATAYVESKDLKSLPDIYGDPEMVENSRLNVKYKQFEIGVGEAGDLEFGFAWENSSATSDYRILKAHADARDVMDFKLEFPDGTAFQFDAQISLKITSSGELNTPVGFTMKCGLQSDIVETPSNGS